MARLRTLRVIDPSYLQTAPVRGGAVQTIPASAEATFRCLEDPDAWSAWLAAITGVEWTSPAPFGIGSTRTVSLRRGDRADEEFFAWEGDRRMAFFFVRTGLPYFAAFAEDYQLEPQGKDRCLLRWSWAFEGAGAFRLLHPVLAAAFRRRAEQALRELENYMRANGDGYQ